MQILKFKSMNGYRGTLYGIHTIEIKNAAGDILYRCPTRTVYNEYDLEKRVNGFPAFLKQLEKLGRDR